MESELSTKASLAELLCALSFVSDIGMGQPMGHGLKTAYIGSKLGEALVLSLEDRQAVYYGALLKDAGCTACATVFATFFAGDDLAPRTDCLMLRPDSVKDAVSWFWRHSPADPALPGRIAGLFSFLLQCRGVMTESVTAHCEVGEMFARRLSLPDHVGKAVRFSWERWDGKGLAYGLAGANAPVAARVLHLAQVVEAALAFGTRSAAEAIAKERRGSQFDPDIVDAFLHLSLDAGFWRVFEQESSQQEILEMRPAADFDQLAARAVEDVCSVLADFADVKSRITWNHSLEVAAISEAVGREMGLHQESVRRLHRAALVHDLGKAAVPVGILEKDHDLTEGEWERFRQHPYYTELVLSRIEPLSDLAREAGAHHEQVDGGGYHQRLSGEQIPVGARIIGLADAYSILQRRVGSPEAALRDLTAAAGSRFDKGCFEALQAVLRRAGRLSHGRTATPGGLTEREVEVLRLAANGLTNREISRTLVISEKTVEHHFENVFNRLGVTSRTAAAVFAVQNGLAP